MAAAQEIIETELDRVERWRTAELMRVGFAGDDAVALAARLEVEPARYTISRSATRPSSRSGSWVDLTVVPRHRHNACP